MTDLLLIGAIGFQLGIIAVVLVAAWRHDIAAAVNAVISLAIALSPWLIAFGSPLILGRNVTVGPELPLWLAVAGLLHSYGMLGPYDSIWWWDTVTHTISAALVAALIYAGLVVGLSDGNQLGLPTGAIPLLTVLFTVAAGIFWELIELFAREVGEHLDIKPVLVHYGLRDTALDLVFDLVGALFVITLDLRLFVPLAEQVPQVTRAVLLGVAGFLVVGSFVTAGLTFLVRVMRL